MTELFQSFCITSFIGTIVALLLFIFKPLTRKLCSSTWNYYMWLFILFVMVIPIKISIIPEAVSVPVVNTVEEYEQTVVDVMPEYTPVNVETVETRGEEPTGEAILTIHSNVSSILPYIWIYIAILLFLIRLLKYAILLIRIKKHSVPVYYPSIYAYTKRKINIKATNTINSPLILGIWKPILLLPEKSINEEQLHFILSHESMHLKRQDILYKWFYIIAKSIHWFNPIIYIIGKEINLECEISCDESVVKGWNREEKERYMKTILSLLTSNHQTQIPLTTGMTGKKSALLKRFSAIKNGRNISKKTKVISIVISVVIIVSTFYVSGILNGKFNFSTAEPTAFQTDERIGGEFNLLTIGVDTNNRIDTIIVFHLDKKNLTGMIIPRNALFASGNDDVASSRLTEILSKEQNDQDVIDAVKTTLQIPIHYYAKISIEAVEMLIDSINGLNFEIPYDMRYDDPHQNLHIQLNEGNQVLTGEQVGHLLRFRDRHLENDEEIRQITWNSVIKEVVIQAIMENRISNIPKLYYKLLPTITTNYSIQELAKDINQVKSMSRNNIIIKTIRGRNHISEQGHFIFHINYVDSHPLLQVFQANASTEKLMSVISYQNDEMGFKIKLPELWKSRYEVIQFDDQIAFLHKNIFYKHGKGYGGLFRITKIKSVDEEKWRESGQTYDLLYWSKDVAYIWTTPSDVQFPIWSNRDQEDEELAKDYEDMCVDLEFIKSSFEYIGPNHTISNKKNKEAAHPLVSPETPHEDIKLTSVSNEPYAGFQQIVMNDASVQNIKNQLVQQGLTASSSQRVDLRRNYILSDYHYNENLSYSHDLTCDSNGNISIYIEGNGENLVDVSFQEIDTQENVGEYVILANNQNIYTFMGFLPDKTYQMNIQGKTHGNWKIEGDYIIY